MTRLRLSTAVAPERYFAFAAMPTDIAAGVETWIQLFKTGDFWDPRYGDFSINGEHLERMAANFAARSVAVPGDFDHSFAKGDGSKAAGWTRELERRGDEMWALVVLTEGAAAAVAGGEYRYISPEFSLNHINERGEAIGPCLLAWGLTNRPFLEGMAEVTLAASRDGRVLARASAAASDDTNPKEGTMDLDKLRRALGLADDADETMVLAAVTQQRAMALTAPGPDSVVLSKAEADTLREQAEQGKTATEALRVKDRDGALEQAVKAGRLAPVALDAFRTMWDADPDSARKALAALPVVEQFRREAAGEPADAPVTLDTSAPIGQQIEERAKVLMAADSTLALAAAYEKADRELRPRAGQEA